MLDAQLLERFNAVQALRADGPIRSYRAVTPEGAAVAIKFVDIEPEIAAEATRAMSTVQSLNSVNVAKVLETGTTDTGYYFVREWVEGTHLGTRPLPAALSPAKAAAAVAQGLAGLSAIHGAGLVCGDVRPTNFVVTADGTTKLVDVVFPPGHVGEESDPPDSAYYTSPEELAGVHPNPRTDIYRAGIVLYEALTGRHPFDGMDAGAVIAGHESAIATPPSAAGPGVSKALDAVAAKALSKDPAQRYLSAAEMQAAIESALKGGWIKWAAIAAAVVVTLAIIGVGISLATRGPAEVVVPQVVGMTQAAAEASLTANGFKVGKVSEVETLTVAPGTVTTQSPAPGASVAASSPVDLGVATLPQVKVPNVVGMLLSDANTTLAQDGLQVGTVAYAYDDKIAAGLVISQAPEASKEVTVGSFVSMTVSKGVKTGQVPNVVGLAETDANSVITAAGFKPKSAPQDSTAVEAGNVISQSPAAGTKIATGSTVTINVSKGAPAAPKVTVPDVVGMKPLEAIRALRDAKLKVKATFAAAAQDSILKVVAQNPKAATQVDEGTQVTITIGLPAFLFGDQPVPLPAPLPAPQPTATPTPLPAPAPAVPGSSSAVPTKTGGSTPTTP